jgi:hypothetical protein
MLFISTGDQDVIIINVITYCTYSIGRVYLIEIILILRVKCK